MEAFSHASAFAELSGTGQDWAACSISKSVHAAMHVVVRCRLRDEVRAKQRELERLEGEVSTLTGTLSTKSRALAAASAASEQLKQRALKAEGAIAGHSAG